MEKRIEFVVRASQAGVNISALCREFRISRPTGYKWIGRYLAANSVTELAEKSRRPRRSPNRTSRKMESLIIELHKNNFGLSGKKIQVLLAQMGHKISPLTVHRVLKRTGFVKPRIKNNPATKHFEREKPNQLWQMDFKGPFNNKSQPCLPLSIIDDHSRYMVGLYALRSTKADGVHDSLRSCFERHGLPDAILTDHGVPWWSTTNGHGLTWLSVALVKQGIKLLWSGYRHPQTQGKVERFHRTLKEGIRFNGKPTLWSDWQPLLEKYRNNYNQVRPHESLGMKTPSERYVRSKRLYNPKPPAWEYPENAEVKRLSTQGCLPLNGRYYFVCEALAHEWVQLKRLDDNLLVKFRGLYIREINLRNNSTRPIVRQDHQINV